MDLPSSININLDVPIEFKSYSQDEYSFYSFNFTHKVVQVHNVSKRDDGVREYTWINNYAIIEMAGGLAYYDVGWRVFDLHVQERYSDYIAEQEVLGGNNDNKV